MALWLIGISGVVGVIGVTGVAGVRGVGGVVGVVDLGVVSPVRLRRQFFTFLDDGGVNGATVFDKTSRNSNPSFSSWGVSTPSESDNSTWRDRGDGEGERVLEA